MRSKISYVNIFWYVPSQLNHSVNNIEYKCWMENKMFFKTADAYYMSCYRHLPDVQRSKLAIQTSAQ